MLECDEEIKRRPRFIHRLRCPSMSSIRKECLGQGGRFVYSCKCDDDSSSGLYHDDDSLSGLFSSYDTVELALSIRGHDMIQT
ncbi:hypothetical protein AKJ16_DCAP04940 [Drosera capensis]